MSFRETFRGAVGNFMRRHGIPGSQYIDGPYLWWRESTVFPRQNARLLDVDPDIGLHGALFNAQDRITIKRGVVLGHQVLFLTGRHDVGPLGVDLTTASQGPIVVEERAWIASRSIIMGGVTIGEGSVIGAGSVVTKSVPRHEFWAGNPARRIRELSADKSGAEFDAAVDD